MTNNAETEQKLPAIHVAMIVFYFKDHPKSNKIKNELYFARKSCRVDQYRTNQLDTSSCVHDFVRLFLAAKKVFVASLSSYFLPVVAVCSSYLPEGLMFIREP